MKLIRAGEHVFNLNNISHIQYVGESDGCLEIKVHDAGNTAYTVLGDDAEELWDWLLTNSTDLTGHQP